MPETTHTKNVCCILADLIATMNANEAPPSGDLGTFLTALNAKHQVGFGPGEWVIVEKVAAFVEDEYPNHASGLRDIIAQSSDSADPVDPDTYRAPEVAAQLASEDAAQVVNPVPEPEPQEQTEAASITPPDENPAVIAALQKLSGIDLGAAGPTGIFAGQAPTLDQLPFVLGTAQITGQLVCAKFGSGDDLEPGYVDACANLAVQIVAASVDELGQYFQGDPGTLAEGEPNAG